MKSRHLSKMLTINNRYLSIERYTLEDSEDDLDDFFDKFHERYRVVEHDSSMLRTCKVKASSKENSKNHSHCSTKRSQMKTVQSSELKRSKAKKASVLHTPLEDKINLNPKKTKAKSKFSNNVARIHFK